MTKKAALIIMDGWGLGPVKSNDAIQNANVPFTNSLNAKYPHTTLVTYGSAVGLPEGQMGNSEVGHMNLGAGRIVYQELERINVDIREGIFQKKDVLLNAVNLAKSTGKKLHLLGLVSDGGVHSHIEHLKAILSLCSENGLHNVLVHAFTDGRDTDPKSGYGFLSELLDHMKVSTGKIATIIGRYYAMDRDKRWERVKIAWDALANGVGAPASDLLAAIEKSYSEGVTDEFLMPIINSNVSNGKIEDGDIVICFNFRTDRCREITVALTQQDFPDFGMHKLNLHYTTMTRYDDTFLNVNVIYEKDNLEDTLGEVVAKAGLTQVRIAETEKYPHVSFFFSGGREVPFEGEKRLMVPSPKVPTYDLQPEMSANEVCTTIINEINTNVPDFICLNFANPDMVGHTGVFPAIIKAVETVDNCVRQVVETLLAHDYSIFLTADHGNADYAINEDGTPNTAHTMNPVPLWFITKNGGGSLRTGKLGDLAPTILHTMNVAIPPVMTGEILTNTEPMQRL